MKIQKAGFVLVGMFVSMSLAKASFAGDVKTDYDRSANFSQYKTYCWQKVETKDPLWVDRIKSAVNSSLGAKGWSEAQSGTACDVAVVAIEMSQQHQTLDTFYNGFGGGWGWRGFGMGGFGQATTTTETYRTGTLIVDLFDAKTKHLVWRGSATDTLSDKSDKNIKNLDKSVRKLFEHFPPEQKSK